MTIESIKNDICCGCSLCSLVCAKKSISMIANNEGFLHPSLDHTTCVDCGLCYKMCPCNDEQLPDGNAVFYASAINDKEQLLRSSSGGNFIALASAFIAQEGYVCGCVFNDKMVAEHICTNQLDDVKRMMGSKYVQSTITACLPVVKQLLSEGHRVLFTGTACQVAAVRQFTRDHKRLYTVDILCHGVPSPLYLEKYKAYLEKKHGGRLVGLQFRNKEKLGWGSEHRTFYVIEKNGKRKGYRPALPAYFCAFFWSLNLRESCYNCKFAGLNRVSDITIGDFWGYWAYFKKRYPEGISIASVNTEKGELLYNLARGSMSYCVEVPQDDAIVSNTNFYHPTVRPSTRSSFYNGIDHLSYRKMRKRVFLDKTARKKLLTSLYGRFMPVSIKQFIRNKILR